MPLVPACVSVSAGYAKWALAWLAANLVGVATQRSLSAATKGGREILAGELGAGAECRAQRVQEGQEQGEHGWMMHDGRCCLPCL